jgi:hypothetical protein
LLSEQGDSSLREALARAGLLDCEDLHIATYRDMAGLSWDEVVAETFRYATGVSAVMLVIDTFPQVSKVRGDDENSSGRALAALEPVQIGADQHGIGVILSFHDRKGGGEVGESGRGSSAYAGAVDIILHVNRAGGNFKRTIRKLETLSRYDATPPELYVELTADGYVSLGSEKDIVTALIARSLLDVLPAEADEAKPVSAIKKKVDGEEHFVELGMLDELAEVGVKAARSTLDNELSRWVKAKYAGRSGAGKKGDPYRYWLIANPPDAFFRSKDTGSSEDTNTEAENDSSDAQTPSEESNHASLNGAVREGRDELAREIQRRANEARLVELQRKWNAEAKV